VNDLASAVSQLNAAISKMAPDDVSFEVSQERSDSRSTTRLRLRAYKHR
jgi:hypothetical protein